jgi:hypothetical protein
MEGVYYSLRLEISVFYTNLVLPLITNIYLYMNISSNLDTKYIHIEIDISGRRYKVYINLMQNLYYVTDTYFRAERVLRSKI